MEKNPEKTRKIQENRKKPEQAGTSPQKKPEQSETSQKKS